MMRASVLAVFFLSTSVLAGCMASDPTPTPSPRIGEQWPQDTNTTWYHLSGARDLRNGTLTGAEDILPAVGGYQYVGDVAREPTIGISSTGTIYYASYRLDGGSATGLYTVIMRSKDHGLTWKNMGPFLPTGGPVVPNSNDPFMFVDPGTDRVYKVDMCLTLSGFCVEFSDNEGETWLMYPPATGEQPVLLDHQSFAAAPKKPPLPAGAYPSNIVFCVNRLAPGPWCSTSVDGGASWLPIVPGYPVGSTQCSGLHGHVKGGSDGTFYRGNPACDGVGVYRSDDGGLTWSEHLVDTKDVDGHDVEVSVDAAGNVYAFWMRASDGMPLLAASADKGEHWTKPIMVAPPGVNATGKPTLAAGDKGRVAFGYIGSNRTDGYKGPAENVTWNGYVGLITDMFASEPIITTVQVNQPEDPLDVTADCGRDRCGGFSDFISMQVDPAGRPYVAFAHDGHPVPPNRGAGIIGTLVSGPALRGPLALLPELGVVGPKSFPPEA